ncbi:MAG: ADP-forming succinate--CoA ligase subunit beta [Verrucomicrobia bacterium]|nr:ADP-forming succinate--CoA ligase subunit beta [Verrucomicrobiota bacterium]
MNLHEFQAKKILEGYGVPIPPFEVVTKHTEAERVVRDLHLTQAVIKIQVHAGGRGKAGGVKFAKTPAEIPTLVSQLLGMKMVNNQTGPEGVIAHKVLISQPVDIVKEYYLGAIIDRGEAQPILIASPEGGMEIEEIAAKSPDKILRVPIELDGTVRPYHLLYLAKFMGWKHPEEGIKIAQAVARCFIEKDAALLEINPLIEDKEHHLWALDAKLSIDDNAIYRQPEIAVMYDPTQVPKNEVEAKKHDLSYIALDGNIGCMVNGAGLAMATMDLIQTCGGKPANFLDVGGSATAEKITAGYKILVSDPHVKAILVNIFGGIMNCATIAEGILAAAGELKVPLVVRMEGTNVEQGRKMLEKSGLKIESAESLEDAAQKVVKILHGHTRK